VSVPTLAAHIPAATATPFPADEDPGEAEAQYGLMVWPPTADQPMAERVLYDASSERFAFPITGMRSCQSDLSWM
jgi:hypothetical protein